MESLYGLTALEYAHIWSCCEQAVVGGVDLSSNLLLNIIHAPVWVVTLVEEPMQCCTTPALTEVQDTLHGQPSEMGWNLSLLSVLQPLNLVHALCK